MPVSCHLERHVINSRGFAAQGAGGAIEPFWFQRRDPSPTDVMIEILYCGICHTDVHFVNNDFEFESPYPLVPGHEIVGRVVSTGDAVAKFAIGDLAAISPIVDSCRVCEACVQGEEQLCEKGYTLTYASFDRTTGGLTYGGYPNNYVVDERFALRLQAEVDLAATAPLLCAGITTYSPLRHWQIGPHSTIGIVGLGGLGHVAVKISHALGATVTVFTSSPGKVDDARRFGARDVVLSTDVDELKRHRGRFNLVLDTVPVDHDINTLIATLERDGTLCLVGIPQRPLSVAAFGLIRGRKRLAGSEIGSHTRRRKCSTSAPSMESSPRSS